MIVSNFLLLYEWYKQEPDFIEQTLYVQIFLLGQLN